MTIVPLILLGLSLLLAILDRRRGAVVGLLLLIYALPRAGVLLRGVQVPLPMGYVLVAVLLFFWLLAKAIGGRWPRTSAPRLIGVYLLTASVALLIGLLSGGDAKVAIQEWCFYGAAVIVYFFAADLFGDADTRRFWVIGLLLAGVAVSAYGGVQYRMGHAALIEGVTFNSAFETAAQYLKNVTVRRVLASYGDPNVLAGQTVLWVALGLYVAVNTEFRLSVRALAAVCLVLACGCLALTGSRAGMASAGLAGVLVALLSRRQVTAAVIGLLMVTLSVWYLGQTESIKRGVVALKRGEDTRANFPLLSLRLPRTVPLGCGLGNTLRIPPGQPPEAAEVRPAVSIWDNLNSFWLSLLSRVGLVGVLLFAGILVLIGRDLFVARPWLRDPYAKALVTSMLAWILAQPVIWLVNNTYQLPGGVLNFWLMVGAATAAANSAKRKSIDRVPAVTRSHPVDAGLWSPLHEPDREEVPCVCS